jgi:hypothetical protein
MVFECVAELHRRVLGEVTCTPAAREVDWRWNGDGKTVRACTGRISYA